MDAAKLLDWTGCTAVIAASGPSLTEAQCLATMQPHVRTIAVNASYRRAQGAWVDLVYMGDYQAVKYYAADVHKMRLELWTCSRLGAEQHQASYVQGLTQEGLGRRGVAMNGNSGAQAVNLAFLFGARKIVLIGFDMKAAPDGRRHWHDEHPKPLLQVSQFGEWLHKANALADDLRAAGCDVVNCSIETALTCFRCGDLEEELACRAPT
jgi:hypothetical protein